MQYPYKFMSAIGQGSYGDIWKCEERETGKTVAIKRFKKENDPSNAFAMKEIRILKSLQHPNIVRYLTAFRSPSDQVYLAMEYHPQALPDLFEVFPQGLPKDMIKLFMYQLLEGIAYMHKMKVLHRDLKPANILISSKRDAIICDAGFAQIMKGTGPMHYSPYVTTRWYRAPEILVDDAYDASVDIWAAGCIMAEMYLGEPLMPGSSTVDQLQMVADTVGGLSKRQTAIASCSKLLRRSDSHHLLPLRERFPSMSPAMMDVLESCLNPDPSRRLTATELLSLPYFFDMDKVKARLASAESLAMPDSPEQLCGQGKAGQLDIGLKVKQQPSAFLDTPYICAVNAQLDTDMFRSTNSFLGYLQKHFQASSVELQVDFRRGCAANRKQDLYDSAQPARHCANTISAPRHTLPPSQAVTQPLSSLGKGGLPSRFSLDMMMLSTRPEKAIKLGTQTESQPYAEPLKIVDSTAREEPLPGPTEGQETKLCAKSDVREAKAVPPCVSAQAATLPDPAQGKKPWMIAAIMHSTAAMKLKRNICTRFRRLQQSMIAEP